MSEPPDIPPFHIQPVLSDIYQSKDLLDLSAPGPTSPRSTNVSSPPPSANLLSSATSIAAAAGRRAAAVASAAASPSSAQNVVFPNSSSPERGVFNGVSERVAEVRCVEGYGPNLYIGGSDGVVAWWVCDGVSTKANGWTLRHKHTLFPRRPVSKIILLPKLSRALILSDGTLHPLNLPSLKPVPSTVMTPLRGVISVILNDDELDWNRPGSEDKSGEMTIVVVRRKGMGIYRLGSRLTATKEIPLPSAPSHHALFSTYLCAAIPSSNTYSIIDLSDASLTEVLPFSQIDASVLEFEPNPNVVVVPGENEFLVTSYTGATTMGVFLNGQGDPVRGTMEWPQHPVTIAVESGYIIALLRNQTIVVHHLSDLEKPAQVVTVDQTLRAFGLSYSPYGISIRDIVRDERMRMTRMLLLGGTLASTVVSPIKDFPPKLEVDLTSMDLPSSVEELSPAAEEPPSGSGLTPPSSPPPFKRQPITPTRGSSLLQATAPTARGPFSTTVAETLIIGPNGIQSFSPTPIITRLDKLCAGRRMDEAMALVDEERRKGRRGEIDGDKVAHQATLRLLHLFLASHLFLEAVFEKAGDYFSRGKIDPRLVVRLYTTFRGKVLGSAEEVEVYEGLKEIFSEMPTLDGAIDSYIERSQGSATTADSQVAPTSTERSSQLYEEAKAMLTDFLRKTRASRRKGGGSRGVDSRKIDIVIDTTLSKLLADAGTTNELLSLLAGPNDVVLSELEPFLTQRPYVLSTVMGQQGRVDRVLALLQEIAESPTHDPLCDDPVEEIAQQLESVKDPELFKRYILWLVTRDADKGLAILMAQNVKTGVKLNDVALVDELRAINENAANRYLEHVVVIKKSPNRQLHEALLARLLDEAAEAVQDDGVKYHLEELDAEYRLQVVPQPFCVFLADIAPNTPIKQLRLKLMLFLQGSPFLDLQAAATRLEDIPALKPELAIVLGRLGRNRQALHLLAREIGDSLSAQTYCTLGGEIIPPKVARMVARLVPELAGCATLGEVGRRKKAAVDAKTQKDLVLELLGVYMRDGATTAKQTAELLNAQAVHLDVLDVLALVPPEWPLDVVSSFFQRALRRQLHDRASSQILKAISAGQNLETSEQYLERIAQISPTILPGPSSGISQPYEGSIAEKEFSSFDEKRDEEFAPFDEKCGEKVGFFEPQIAPPVIESDLVVPQTDLAAVARPSQIAQVTVISAPGKVLLAGGYLVLDRLYTGLVVATSSRFYCCVSDRSLEPIQYSSSSESTRITVRAGQFPSISSTWNYILTFEDGGMRLEPESVTGKNKFVEITLAKTLELAWEIIHETGKDPKDAGMELLRRIRGDGGMLEIKVFADNDFYSQREQLAEQDLPQLLSSLSSLPPFCPLPRPIHQINKTGLGSSASLVTSLVAALLSYLDLIILPSPSQSEALHHSEQPPPKDGSGLDLVHSLAQYAHCLAQGKVGSGFDISSAVYGTHMYRRFSPSLLTPLLETPATSINHSSGLLATLDPKAWDQDVTPFRLPRGLRLMLADVDAGTDTPSFIGKVLAWHQQETEVALELWTDLGKANDALAELLQELCGHEEDSDYGTILTEASLLPPDELDLSRPVSQLLVRIRASLNLIRSYLQHMSTLSSVPIEPESQTRLLDACSSSPGVLGGGVPGAGGFDAIFLLVIDEPVVVRGVEKIWEGWTEMSVCPLLARQSDGGLRSERLEGVEGLREAYERL